MRLASFDARMHQLNRIYRQQADRRAGVTYVDARRLFTVDGAYSPYLEDDAGQEQLMRQQDGIHLTRAGGERLATVVFDEISQDWPVSPR